MYDSRFRGFVIFSCPLPPFAARFTTVKNKICLFIPRLGKTRFARICTLELCVPKSWNSAPTGGFVPGGVLNRVGESRRTYLLHLGSAGGNSPGCGMGSWLIHGARSGYVCRQMPTGASDVSQMSEYGGQKLSWVPG
jgi:hypothetical protein